MEEDIRDEGTPAGKGALRRTVSGIRAWGEGITGRRLLTVTYIIIALVGIAGLVTVASIFR